MTGLRPIAELQFADFIWNAADETYAKMSKWRYMHGGQVTVPMVLRLPEGAPGAGSRALRLPRGLDAARTPARYIVVPSTPADAKGLLKTAIRSDDPVAFFEHKMLYATKGPRCPRVTTWCRSGRPTSSAPAPTSPSSPGARMVSLALQAAERAAADGHEVEVLDTRGLRPLDVAGDPRVGREDRPAPDRPGGPEVRRGRASEIAAIVAEEGLDLLEAPIRRIGAADVPIPQNAELERFAIPTVDDVQVAIKELLA